MFNAKGKASNLRVRLTYLLLGFFLLIGGDTGLILWYVFAPQFVSLITYLVLVYSLVILYFIILRGVFLNQSSGYGIIDGFLVIRDGYPMQKEIRVRVESITKLKLKKVKGFFKFGLGKLKIYVSEKKYVLKNVPYSELENLKKELTKDEI